MFLGLARFTEELFVNKEYWEREGLFKKDFIPGPLILTISTGLMQQLGLLEGTALALLGFDEIRFPKPVSCGDTLYAEIEIADKREDHAGRGIVTFKETTTNQDGEVVMHYKRTLMMRCKESD